MTVTTPMPASPCTRRRFLKHSATLSAAVLGGALRRRPAAAALSKVVRVGFIAHLGSTQGPPRAPAVLEVAGYAGLLGARAGAEEMGANARLLGREFELKMATATTPAAAVREARRLAAAEKVFAIVGGYDTDVALALSEFAEQSRLVFFNVGATSDALRNESCRRYTFHIEASDAMYLDAIVDWFTRGLAFLVDEDAPEGVRIVRRTPTRRWFLVTADSPAWQARRRRTHAALERRHWGGRIVGDAVVDPDSSHARDALRAIEQTHPDLVFLLLGPQAQLAFLKQFGNAALRVEVSGFPEPLTQTRTFLAALLDATPRSANEGIRAVLWDPVFRFAGALELNSRFAVRWKHPMDGPAWASWCAVKILWEVALRAQTTDPAQVVGYLESDRAVLDGHKGIVLTFRRWDHQLRQPLEMIRLKRGARDLLEVAEPVGGIPNVNAPGRDPQQVLDQLGDLAQDTKCRFSVT
jgi:ABC-type branched-subunit amino acid transport system substrate-binding protein